MPSPLSYIYSSIDSLKRQLFDALANPVAHAERSIGYGMDKLGKQRELLNTANSKSVLVSKEQKEGAQAQAVDAMMGLLAGNAGIMVPVTALPKMTKGLASDIRRELDIDPAAAWDQYRAYYHPKSGDAIAHIPSSITQLNKKALKEYKNLGTVAIDSAAFSSRPTVADIVDVSRYPKDLQQLFASTKVYNRLGKGAEYSPRGDSITIGEMKSPEELFSTLIHEMTHGSQYLYDLPFGGSTSQFVKNYGDIKNAAVIINTKLDALAKKGIEPKWIGGSAFARGQIPSKESLMNDADSLSDMLAHLSKIESTGLNQYERLAGEAEARMAEQYLKDENFYTAPKTLLREMGLNKSDLLLNAKEGTVVGDDPITRSILNLIIERPGAAGAKP